MVSVTPRGLLLGSFFTFTGTVHLPRMPPALPNQVWEPDLRAVLASFTPDADLAGVTASKTLASAVGSLTTGCSSALLPVFALVGPTLLASLVLIAAAVFAVVASATAVGAASAVVASAAAIGAASVELACTMFAAKPCTASHSKESVDVARADAGP